MKKNIFLVIILIFVSSLLFSQITLIANFVDSKGMKLNKSWVTVDIEILRVKAKAEIIEGIAKIQLPIDIKKPFKGTLRLRIFSSTDNIQLKIDTPKGSVSEIMIPFIFDPLKSPKMQYLSSPGRIVLTSHEALPFKLGRLALAAPPSFSPASGTYSGTQKVKVYCKELGGTIRYTTNGSNPTTSYGTIATDKPIIVSRNTTIKALVYFPDGRQSATSTATYSIKTAQPVLNPIPGEYSNTQSITLTSATAGATIQYTLDGTNPSATAGNVYSGPITISETKTIKAIAYKSDMAASSIITGEYKIIGMQVMISDAIIFETDGMDTCYLARIDANKTRIIYSTTRDGNTNYDGRWKIFDNSGSTISQWLSYWLYPALSIAQVNYNNGNTICAYNLTRFSKTITHLDTDQSNGQGVGIDWLKENGNYVFGTLLNDGNILLAYKNDSNKGKFVIVNQQGKITPLNQEWTGGWGSGMPKDPENVTPYNSSYNPTKTFSSNVLGPLKAFTLVNGKILIVFKADTIRYKVINANADVIVDETTLEDLNSAPFDCTKLTNNNLLFAYSKDNSGKYKIISSDGSSIINQGIFFSTGVDRIKILSLSDSKALIVFRDINDSNKMKSIVLNPESGETLTQPMVICQNSISSIDLAMLDNGNVMIVYNDEADNNGKLKTISFP